MKQGEEDETQRTCFSLTATSAAEAGGAATAAAVGESLDSWVFLGVRA